MIGKGEHGAIHKGRMRPRIFPRATSPAGRLSADLAGIKAAWSREDWLTLRLKPPLGNDVPGGDFTSGVVADHLRDGP